MRAAKNFAWGGKADADKPRQDFKVGDKIPSAIANELDDSFFLEKIKKRDLTREQLLLLAGKDVVEEDDGDEEIDEKEFREGMANIRTKGELASWAKEMLGVDVDENQTREEMEEAIVSAYLVDEGEEVDDDNEDEDE